MIETGDGQKFDPDSRYSFKDHTGHDLSGRKDMDKIVIARSCFSQERPGTECFPAGMTGTTFVECNLDNCDVPPGCTVVQCSQKRFEAQTDGHDWEVDSKGAPLKRVNEEVFIKKGLDPPSPADLPAEAVASPVEDFASAPLVLVEVPPEKALAFEDFLAQQGLKKGSV